MSEAQARARPSDDPRLDPIAIERERRALERTWSNSRGLVAWLSSVDHKAIGKRSIVTAFVFFVLGGLLAALMRIQLARPDNTLPGPRPLQPDLHDARHDDDVPVRRAGDAGAGASTWCR